MEKVLVDKRSEFQHIQMFETKKYGNMLTLDGVIQVTERDEHSYQVHLALHWVTHCRRARPRIVPPLPPLPSVLRRPSPPPPPPQPDRASLWHVRALSMYAPCSGNAHEPADVTAHCATRSRLTARAVVTREHTTYPCVSIEHIVVP